jgi:hypothetical protein
MAKKFMVQAVLLAGRGFSFAAFVHVCIFQRHRLTTNRGLHNKIVTADGNRTCW